MNAATPLKIVFMGTPDFAVASLERMLSGRHRVVAVVTAPDKPAGRGQQVRFSPVKTCALAHGLPLLQPDKLKDPAFLHALGSYGADLFVVVAFRMLPREVWTMPRLGTINVHGSLLPHYRGAAPIHHAVMNGEKTTGVTTFFIEEQIDTGKIIGQRSLSIGEDEDTGSVYSRLMVLGAGLLADTVEDLAQGRVSPVDQSTRAQGESLKEAPKLHRDTCQIDWNQPVKVVHDFVRGLSPLPAAWCVFQGKVLKIFRGHPVPDTPTSGAGSFESDGRQYLRFFCTDGYYEVHELQAEGKKRMRTEEWLRGIRFIADAP